MNFKSNESRERHASSNRKKSLNRSIKIKNKYLDNPKKCKYCKEILQYEKRANIFCNKSCAASFNNTGLSRNNITGIVQSVNITKTYCEFCGKITKRHNKYCSNQCQSTYKHLIYINKWLLGIESGSCGSYGINSNVRRYLFDVHNSKCEECGWGLIHPETSRIPLQIHHLDGDCTNNKLENIKLLCPNCHVMTSNHGSRNKNCTRIDRRLRY